MAERTMVGIQVLWVVLAVCWKLAAGPAFFAPPLPPPPASPPAFDGAHDCGGAILVRSGGSDVAPTSRRCG